MSTLEEHFAGLSKVKAEEGYSRRHDYLACLLIQAHQNELEEAVAFWRANASRADQASQTQRSAPQNPVDAGLLEALRPFAEIAEEIGRQISNHGRGWDLDGEETVQCSVERIDGSVGPSRAELSVEDFRKARSAIARAESSQGEAS